MYHVVPERHFYEKKGRITPTSLIGVSAWHDQQVIIRWYGLRRHRHVPSNTVACSVKPHNNENSSPAAFAVDRMTATKIPTDCMNNGVAGQSCLAPCVRCNSLCAPLGLIFHAVIMSSRAGQHGWLVGFRVEDQFILMLFNIVLTCPGHQYLAAPNHHCAATTARRPGGCCCCAGFAVGSSDKFNVFGQSDVSGLVESFQA